MTNFERKLRRMRQRRPTEPTPCVLHKVQGERLLARRRGEISPLEGFIPLGRNEVRGVLACATGHLYRPIHVYGPVSSEPLPPDAHFAGVSTDAREAGHTPLVGLLDRLVYVFHRGPAGRVDRILVDGNWGEPGDRLLVQEHYHRLESGTVEYEADFEPGERPRTKYWKPAKDLGRRNVRLVLEITGLRPVRLQEAAASRGEYGERVLRTWDERYSRWGTESSENPWAWEIGYQRLVPGADLQGVQ
jgi:hypothetical protein